MQEKIQNDIVAKIANKPTCKSRKNETADAVAEWIQTSATLTEIQKRPCKAAKLSKAPKSVKLLEIPLYPPKKSAAQKICTKRLKLPGKKHNLQNRLKTESIPQKIPKPPEHSKNCQSSFKNSENRLKTQKSPKLTQKSKKITENSHTKRQIPAQFPAQQGKFPHKTPKFPHKSGGKLPKNGFWAKFAFLALLVHEHRFFSESVPKRPETAFSDKNSIFCFVSRKQSFFSEFKYFCLAWFWSGFCKFLPFKMLLRKNSRVFWLAWYSNSQLEEVEWFWRLIGEMAKR